MAVKNVDKARVEEISNENTPLLLPPEDTLPIDVVSSPSNGNEENGNHGTNDSLDKRDDPSSASPMTVVLVLIVGMWSALPLLLKVLWS
jgi:hypothetical protein